VEYSTTRTFHISHLPYIHVSEKLSTHPSSKTQILPLHSTILGTGYVKYSLKTPYPSLRSALQQNMADMPKNVSLFYTALY